MNALTHTRSGRHPVNVAHLVMGLAFLGLAGAWALLQSDVVSGDDVRWLLPLPCLIAGAAGLAAVAVKGVRGSRAPTDDTHTNTDADTDTDVITDIPEEQR